MTLQRYVSDELTHFVGRGLRAQPEAEDRQYELLVNILRGGQLGTDKTKHTAYADASKFSENEYYKPNVVCFSDIPVPDLAIHMGKFSRFGLAFRKAFLVAKGANPVFYLPRQAQIETSPGRQVDLASHFDQRHQMILSLFRNLPTMGDGDMPSLAPGLSNQQVNDLLGFLVFHFFSLCKFYDAGLPADDPANYYMEREWRVFGRLDFDLQAVSRVIFPERFAKRFRDDLPEYYGEIIFS
ncbi:MAG: hypothetical protein HY794_12430 [Desulfarculus sp.]|nr:hypothetical protein [Desulfarculus sp.]